MKYILGILLTVIIIGVGIYAVILIRQHYAQERALLLERSSSQRNQPQQLQLPGKLTITANFPSTDKGLREEVARRLSGWYKKPIEEVIAGYKKKLKENPDDIEARMKLAEIYVYFPENHKEALAHFKEVLITEPDHPKKEYIDFWVDALEQPVIEFKQPVAQPTSGNKIPNNVLQITTVVPPIPVAGISIKELLEPIQNNKNSEIPAGIVEDSVSKEEIRKSASTVNISVSTENIVEKGQIPTKQRTKPLK